MLKVLKSWVVYSAQSRCQKPLRSMWLINPFQLIMASGPIGCTLWLITQLIYSIYVIRWNKKAQQTSGSSKGQVHYLHLYYIYNEKSDSFQVQLFFIAYTLKNLWFWHNFVKSEVSKFGSYSRWNILLAQNNSLFSERNFDMLKNFSIFFSKFELQMLNMVFILLIRFWEIIQELQNWGSYNYGLVQILARVRRNSPVIALLVNFRSPVESRLSSAQRNNASKIPLSRSQKLTIYVVKGKIKNNVYFVNFEEGLKESFQRNFLLRNLNFQRASTKKCYEKHINYIGNWNFW